MLVISHNRVRLRGLLTFLLLLAITLSQGCAGGGKTAQTPVTLRSRVTPGDSQTTAPAGGLPHLAEFESTKAPSNFISWRCGMDYLKDMPSARLEQTDELSVKFKPVGDAPDEIAYAVYSFNLADMNSVSLQLKRVWNDGFPVYIGLSDFSARRWRWFSINSDDQFQIDDVDRYRRDDGLNLVAVVVAGVDERPLQFIGFSSHELYDEVEPNNHESEAQLLPPLPVYAFRGSLGDSSNGVTGYDGGNTDIFELRAEDNSVLSIEIHVTGLLAATNQERWELTNAEGLLLAGELNDNDGCTVIGGLSYLQDKGPYYLSLTAFHTEYELYIIEGEGGAVPEVQLAVSPKSGPAPLLVTLDASGSSDPNPSGSITRYDWDFEGDGIWDSVGGSEPVIQHSYDVEGIYSPRVRVGNALGLGRQDAAYSSAPGRKTVTVGESPYDEVEDNEGRHATDYNTLPNLPFEQFSGSVGYSSGGAGSGYDEDGRDSFLFSAEGGVSHSFIDLNFHEGNTSPFNGSNVSLGIRRLDGEFIASNYGYGKSVSFKPKQSGEYILEVGMTGNQGEHKYLLRGMNNAPPDVAALHVDKLLGPVPLVIDAELIAHDPEGGPLTYGWSVNSSYVEEEHGIAETAQITLEQAGRFTLRSFATDEAGLRTLRHCAIYATAHQLDELEPNDTKHSAQPLPVLPLSGFAGSLCGVANGYDGDELDQFELAEILPAGDILQLNVSYLQGAQQFEVLLLDSNANVIRQTTASNGLASLNYLVSSQDSQPFQILLTGEAFNPTSEIHYFFDLMSSQ